MKIKHNIPKHDDKIGISKEVQSFCELVNELETPVTIAINGKWGTGKSKFVELCIQHYERKKDNGEREQPEILPIYINAWENDYSEDPLVILLANILKTARENNLIEDQLDEKIRKEAGRLFKAALPALLKLGSAGLVGIHELDSVIEKYSESVLDDYYKERESLDKLKTLLNDLISSPRKIIVFVDELDRCNPLFSIKMLERVKHLFEIPNVIFVFSVDKIQLSAAISKVYGLKYDSTGYLWRFFNLTYELPVKREEYIEHLYAFYNFMPLLDQERFKRTNIDSNQIMVPLKAICSFEKIGLRDCEFLMTRLHLFMRSFSKRGFTYPLLSVFILTLYHFKRNLYLSYFDPEKDVSELTDYVRKIGINSKNESVSPHLTALLILSKEKINNKTVTGVSNRINEISTDTRLSSEEREFAVFVRQGLDYYRSRRIEFDPMAFRQSIEQLSYWNR